MQPVPSTAEILAYRILNRGFDAKWVNWAVEMLMAGFDTENLVILAGISPPYNQFELWALADKVFNELHLDYSDGDKVLKNYASYLVSQCLIGQRDYTFVLSTLKDIYESDRDSMWGDFSRLYWAKDDLLHDEAQYYWEGANISNIDGIIKDYFTNWLVEHPVVFRV